MRLATSKIKTRKQRLALKVRAAPYFKTLAPKRVLGYVRKAGENVAGFWICRLEIGRDDTTGAIRRRGILGAADDLVDANGTDILDYEQARALASVWQPEDVRTAVRGAFLVSNAVEQHRHFLGEDEDKTVGNQQRDHASLRFHVLGLEADEKTRRLDGEGKPMLGLGHIEVNKLTSDGLRTWRDDLEKVHGLKPASALRTWTNFHSCLEQAADKKDNGITARPWRDVKPMKQQDMEGRQLHFTNDEAAKIIDYARCIDPQAADYFEALFRTGCRPGSELFALTVSDFTSGKRLSIRGRSEGVKSKTGKRQVALDGAGSALFTRLVADRPSTAPLLSPDGERHWEINNDRNRIKAVLLAAVQAVLPQAQEEDIVPYAFRHTFISRRLEAGMPISLVAEHCGTSEYMIQRNYAKFCPKETERWISETAPKAPKALRVVKTEETTDD